MLITIVIYKLVHIAFIRVYNTVRIFEYTCTYEYAISQKKQTNKIDNFIFGKLLYGG